MCGHSSIHLNEKIQLLFLVTRQNLVLELIKKKNY